MHVQVLQACETQASDSGLVSVDVVMLHRLLMQEVNTAGQQMSSSALPHRDALVNVRL